MPEVMLCGFWTHATTEVADVLLAADPALRRTGDGEQRLVLLPAAYEPDHLRTGTAGRAPVVMTVVPADLVLDGLTDETSLREAGLPVPADDRRAVGDLVIRQIEQADVVVLTGRYEGDDWENEQLRLILQRIAPWAEHCDLAAIARPPAGRDRPVEPLTRGLRGRAVGVDQPVADHGVVSCTFQARRPFHPQRLHDALDLLTDRVLRSRGHFWLASRPDLVMTWESAGGLTIGPASGWLADLPSEHWDAVDDERSLAARLDWDPYYGDRHQHLAFVGVDIDAGFLHRTLTGCLLTDDELARGESAWRALPDPFRRSYPA